MGKKRRLSSYRSFEIEAYSQPRYSVSFINRSGRMRLFLAPASLLRLAMVLCLSEAFLPAPPMSNPIRTLQQGGHKSSQATGEIIPFPCLKPRIMPLYSAILDPSSTATKAPAAARKKKPSQPKAIKQGCVCRFMYSIFYTCVCRNVVNVEKNAQDGRCSLSLCLFPFPI